MSHASSLSIEVNSKPNLNFTTPKCFDKNFENVYYFLHWKIAVRPMLNQCNSVSHQTEWGDYT